MGYKKKSLTKRGRIQDRKRISLTSKHELDYMKRIAKEQLERLTGQKGQVIWSYGSSEMCSKAKLIRITRGLLKFLK